MNSKNLTAEAQRSQRGLNEISSEIIGAAMEVHSQLGPGLLESAYERAMAYELQLRGLDVKTQVDVPLTYKGQDVGTGFRLDLLVEHEIIVEIKSVDAIAPIHLAQLLTYLKLRNCNLGLILNFNSKSMREGIKRVANNFTPSATSAPLR
jgi:GxxExxY protein